MTRSTANPEPKPHPSGLYWLQLLRRRRTKPPPRPGDFFVCCTPEHKWLGGRVVFDHMSGAYPKEPPVGIELVLYVYRGLHDSIEEVPLPPRKPDLLVPPDFYNQTVWTQGIAYILGNWPMQPEEYVPRHVFRDHRNVKMHSHDPVPIRVCLYRDEHYKIVEPLDEPMGMYGLGAASRLSHHVQQALTGNV